MEQVTESLTACKKLNVANNHVSLEANPSPAVFSDKNTALVKSLTAVLQRTQLSSAWIPHAQKL